MNNSVTRDTTNSDINSQLHEASTSQFIQNKQNEYSLYSDSSLNINDLLLKIPQLLLEQQMQKIDSNKVSTYTRRKLE